MSSTERENTSKGKPGDDIEKQWVKMETVSVKIKQQTIVKKTFRKFLL